MSQTTIDISVPSYFAGVLEAVGRGAMRVGVEHAKLDCRMQETAIALALQDALEGRRVVVFVEHLQRAKYLAATWFSAAGIKTRRFSTDSGEAKFQSYDFDTDGGPGTLWLSAGRNIRVEDLPFATVDRVWGLRCDQITTPLPTLFDADVPAVLTGVLADRDHWFYDFCQGLHPDDLTRVGMETVVEKFKDQRKRVPPKTDPFYERHFELQDVQPKFTSQAFLTFARRRLHIRTDKPMEVLDAAQRAQARDQHGTPVVSFQVSKLQKKYLAKKRLAVKQGKKPWYVLLKYRRGGFTTIEQGLSYQMATSRPRSDVATLAHTAGSTSRIFKIAMLMHEKDPESPPRLNDGKSSLVFENGSTFFIGTAGGQGFARGDTLQRVHGSEVAKWCRSRQRSSMEDVEDLAAGLLGAASFGEVIFESTPNGREYFCETYEDAVAGLNEFTPIFLRWFDDPINVSVQGSFNPEEIRDTITGPERALIEKFGLTIPQIAFRREAKKRYKRLFPQEMPEDDKTCFLASGVCYFDVEVLLSLLDILPAEMRSTGRWMHHPGGYEVRWREPEAGVEYVAGVDTSEGLPGCDKNGIGILNKETGEQVASLHGLFNPRLLADHCVRMCKDYNNALLGIERENHGHAVIQRVVDMKYRKPHFRGGPLFYFDRKQDIKKSRAGWTTNGATRPVMLEDLAEAIDQGWMKIHDTDFIGECLSFRLQSNGKFEADSGAKDDQVMKWAIAWQMRKYRRPKPRIGVAGEAA